MLLGKRLGYGKTAMPPHNITYTAMGPPALGRLVRLQRRQCPERGRMASQRLHGHPFCRRRRGLTWAGLEWIFRGKPSVLGACSGVVAGLVCITPASGYVTPCRPCSWAWRSSVCYFACTVVKTRFGYDDSLDAFGVHGVGGTLGAILTGVFATRAPVRTSANRRSPLGLLEGGPLLKAQIVAVLITWGWRSWAPS